MLYISYANESSRLDKNLPARSQFYSDQRVHLSKYRYCQSATFGPLAFCVCSLFFTILNQKEFRIATVAMFISDLNAGVVATAARPRTATHDYGRIDSCINKISFHGFRRFIFTGSCSATHRLQLKLVWYNLLKCLMFR